MSDDIIDIFSGTPVQRGAKCLPPLPKPPRAKRPYKAYEIGNETQYSLRAVNSVGAVRLLPYPFLNEVLFLPGRHQIDLFYNVMRTCMVVMIWGPNLELLIEPLQDRKVRTITSFNTVLHLRPDEKEPVVTEISTASLKTYYEHREKKQTQL